MASNDHTSKPNTKKKLFTLLKHSKQDSDSVAPLRKQNSVHQDDPTKATQSVLSRKSPNSLSSFCHMKLQESTYADRSMQDITVTSKGIEKLLSNLNPHKAAGTDQIFVIFPQRPITSDFKGSWSNKTYHPIGLRRILVK